jgi:hypothetical protein
MVLRNYELETCKKEAVPRLGHSYHLNVDYFFFFFRAVVSGNFVLDGSCIVAYLTERQKVFNYQLLIFAHMAKQ